MKKRTKSLLAAFCTMALCGCLVAGSTYALFTSDASVNISVTSGKVNITSNVVNGSVKTYSATTTVNDSPITVSGDLGNYAGSYYYGRTNDDNANGGNFKNGGSAELTTDVTTGESTVTLKNITPGDKVEFDINVVNNSNVAILYRTAFSSEEKNNGDNVLMNALKLSVNENTASAVDTTSSDSSSSYNLDFSGYVKYVTEWEDWAVPQTNSDKNVSLHAVIELPLETGNEYMNKSIDIQISFEAVQANAYVGLNTPSMTTAPVVVKTDKDDAFFGENSKVSVSIPDGVTTNDNSAPKVTIESSDYKLGNTISLSNSSSYVSYEISSNFTQTSNSQYVSVAISDVENEITAVYHNGNIMATSEAQDKEDGYGNGYFVYDATTKTLTIYTKSFSPFTIEYKYAGGLGTESSPYLVSTVKQLQNLENGTTSSKKYYTLANDINFESSDIIDTAVNDYSQTLHFYMPKYISNIVLNGNDKAINFVENNSLLTYGINSARNCEFTNLNVDNINVAFVLCGRNITMDTVIIDGEINYNCNNWCSFVQCLYEGTSYFKNCTNEADIQGRGGDNGYNSIFVANPMGQQTIYFENCVNNGKMVSGRASMFVANKYDGAATLYIKNCVNNGSIRATYIGSNYNHSDFIAIGESYCNVKVWNNDSNTYETKSITDKYLSNIYQGPEDNITITKNSDNTFTFTSSTLENAAKYTVSVGLYTYVTNGTLLYYVSEDIEASQADSYTTQLKLLGFVDKQWVESNEGSVESGTIAGNVTYTKDGTTYYLVNNDLSNVNGVAKAASIVVVCVYDSNGKLLSSVNYNING
jgi:predicted ribosomally synthesized peptide with SipW-like signal peptide